MLSVRKDHLIIQKFCKLHFNLFFFVQENGMKWRKFIDYKQSIIFSRHRQNNVIEKFYVQNTADSIRFDSICEREHFLGKIFLI